MNKRSMGIVMAMTLLSLAATARHKARIGISAEAAIKVLPIKYYTTFGAKQPAITLRVYDEQPNALGLWISLGFLMDKANYRLLSESTPASKMHVGMLQRNLSLNGLIVFPTRSEYFNILAGIGMDYNMATDASYTWTGTNYSSTVHTSADLDSIQTVFDQHRRKWLPSASAGLQFEHPQLSGLKIYLLLRQNLLDLYDEDIPVYTIATAKNGQPATNYKPTYLRLGLNYEF